MIYSGGEYWFFGYVFAYDKLGYLLESFKETKGVYEQCSNQRTGYSPNSSTFLFKKNILQGNDFYFSLKFVCVSKKACCWTLNCFGLLLKKTQILAKNNF